MSDQQPPSSPPPEHGHKKLDERIDAKRRQIEAKVDEAKEQIEQKLIEVKRSIASRITRGMLWTRSLTRSRVVLSQ